MVDECGVEVEEGEKEGVELEVALQLEAHQGDVEADDGTDRVHEQPATQSQTIAPNCESLTYQYQCPFSAPLLSSRRLKSQMLTIDGRQQRRCSQTCTYHRW